MVVHGQSMVGPQPGHVLTYFDRVGTVGMERDYLWSFVPYQAVRVPFRISRQPSNRPE